MRSKPAQSLYVGTRLPLASNIVSLRAFEIHELFLGIVPVGLGEQRLDPGFALAAQIHHDNPLEFGRVLAHKDIEHACRRRPEARFVA